jgi:RNA polymerase sigma-70 factor (ECF subfamily)
VRGIEQFEGRSTLRGWLLRILVNRALSTGQRERRSVAVADVESAARDPRFDASGGWITPPSHWADDVEERLSAQALRGLLDDALAALPPRQLAVVTLRDIEELDAVEGGEVLGLSEANQRAAPPRPWASA